MSKQLLHIDRIACLQLINILQLLYGNNSAVLFMTLSIYEEMVCVLYFVYSEDCILALARKNINSNFRINPINVYSQKEFNQKEHISSL